MVLCVGGSSLELLIKLPCPVLMSLRSWIQTEEHAMSMTAPAHIKLLCGPSLLGMLSASCMIIRSTYS
jgi:hypothetical protein